MKLDYSPINLLILFGALQGFISMVLAFSNRRHPGAFYLGLVMVSLVYNGLETFNWSSGLEEHILLFDFYPFVTIFLIGPSFYLYFQTLYYKETYVSTIKKTAYFAPFLFQFLFLTLGWIATLLTLMGIIDLRAPLEKAMNFYLNYSEPWSLLVFLGYTVFSLRLYFKAKEEKVLDKKAVLRTKQINSWVKSLLVFQVILAILWTATLLLPYILKWPFRWSPYYPVELLLVIFLYWIAIVGYSKLKSISNPDLIEKDTPNLLQADEARENLRILNQAMKFDKIFLNPDLNLAALSQHTGITAKLISQTLNQLAGSNFNDFVNSFRINEFCIEIQKQENKKLTLTGVASRCGFNSPATFQRTFKKLKGETPKVFANREKETYTSN